MPETNSGKSDNYIKRISCGIDNCFIIRQGDHAILVDSGRKRYRQKILTAAREEDVELLVLTHGHYNHVCNAALISEDLDIPVAMHAADVDLLSDNHLQRMHANTFLGYIAMLYCHKIRRNPYIQRFYPEVYLQEGDKLDDFGIDARVIELPGHTLGSIGLDVWGTDLIVGDACNNKPRPGKAIFYGNRDMMEKSCEKITAIGDRMVHLGHGDSIPNRVW
ncbi:MAG: MBL fold metallo-hydrolase [Coriobacteriales bacterium]|jgi:hydroxyacylglutathione hydrolase